SASHIYALSLHDALPICSHTIKVGGEFRDLITTGLFLARSRGDYIYGSFDELIRDSVPTFSALRVVGSPEFVGNQLFFNAFIQEDRKSTRLNSSHVKISY